LTKKINKMILSKIW